MKIITASFGVLAASLLTIAHAATPLGLPPVPVPQDNPITTDKVKLGEKLFHDKRFSADGTVSCSTCHEHSQTHALFTDSRFHNLGIGFERINKDVYVLASVYRAKQKGVDMDVEVLTNKNTSELGRFVVTTEARDMGSFKTPTLRNIAKTSPYMHDGSLETLKDVVKFYNNGGRVKESDPIFDFQSGGIRLLDLSEDQFDDLVALMEAFTSPEYK